MKFRYLLLVMILIFYGCGLFKDKKPEIIIDISGGYTSRQEDTIKVIVEPQGSYETFVKIEHFNSSNITELKVENSRVNLNYEAGMNFVSFLAVNDFGDRIERKYNIVYDGEEPQII